MHHYFLAIWFALLPPFLDPIVKQQAKKGREGKGIKKKKTTHIQKAFFPQREISWVLTDPDRLNHAVCTDGGWKYEKT